MKKSCLILALCMALMMWAGAEAESPATEGYYTYVVTDGEAAITDVDTAISGAVTVPAELGGYPVTRIGDYAFEDCGNITELVILGNVKSIGAWAFNRCINIENLTLSEGIAEIKGEAFFECHKIAHVIIPSSVTNIGVNPFGRCSALLTIEAPQNKQYSVKNGMLFNRDETCLICCPAGLAPTEIPENVEEIGLYAFAGCKMREITIPDTVQRIEDAAFSYCSNLECVKSAAGIRADCGGIEGHTFWNCTRLQEISLHQDTEYIPNGYFKGCTSLETVTIPEHVQFFGSEPFDGCTSLKTIYFLGDAPSMDDTSIPNRSTLTIYYPNDTYAGVIEKFPDVNWVPTFYTIADDDGGGDTIEIFAPEAGQAVVVFAAYAPDGSLSAADIVPVVLQEGENQVTAENFKPEDGHNVSVMLLKSVPSMHPLCKVWKG